MHSRTQEGVVLSSIYLQQRGRSKNDAQVNLSVYISGEAIHLLDTKIASLSHTMTQQAK